LKRKYENFRFHIFASIHTLISLNQGQGSIFKLRKVRAIDFSPRGFWAREIDWRKSHVQKNFPDPLVVKACNVFSKKCYMFSPLGGQENFFWTWDLRQSISRARKPHVLNKWYKAVQKPDSLGAFSVDRP